MSAEIRKLKDGELTVYPQTVGTAVILEDGTTVQDLADKKVSKPSDSMKVVVGRCIPQTPRIGMRYYYPGGVFGVKGFSDYSDSGVKSFIINNENQLITLPVETQNFYYPLVVPSTDYKDRKPNLLITIVDPSQCDYSIPINDGYIYISVSSTEGLNCDTSSPYLKVINGKITNVEKIQPPKKMSGPDKFDDWMWYLSGYTDGSIEGVGVGYENRFTFTEVAHNQQWPSHVIYGDEELTISSKSYYNIYNIPNKRNRLKHPKGYRNIRFYSFRPNYKPRVYNGSGVSWIGNPVNQYNHIRNLPYVIRYCTGRYLLNMDGRYRHLHGDFMVKTFRRGRKGVDCCYVTAYNKTTYIYDDETDTLSIVPEVSGGGYVEMK